MKIFMSQSDFERAEMNSSMLVNFMLCIRKLAHYFHGYNFFFKRCKNCYCWNDSKNPGIAYNFEACDFLGGGTEWTGDVIVL